MFGVLTAVATQGQSIPQTILRTAAISGTENIALDGSAQPADVVANVAGGVAARYTGNAVSTPSISLSVQAAIEGTADISVYSAVTRLFDWVTN